VPAQRVTSGSPYEPLIGFTRAIRVGRRVLVSGTGPVWPDGSCPGDAGAQAHRVLEIISAALAERASSRRVCARCSAAPALRAAAR
jgi:enamine deaminase RidA (YjgF/YER057c/UK114 family)